MVVVVLLVPFPGDDDAEEFRGRPTVEPRPMSGPKIKDKRSSVKDGALERLR